MIFNELCPDGVIRPIKILPVYVTCVKKPDAPINVSRYGLEDAKFKGGTILVHKGREIILYEPLDMVITALGVAMAASDFWNMYSFHAGVWFEEQKIKYSPEFDRIS